MAIIPGVGPYSAASQKTKGLSTMSRSAPLPKQTVTSVSRALPRQQGTQTVPAKQQPAPPPAQPPPAPQSKFGAPQQQAPAPPPDEQAIKDKLAANPAAANIGMSTPMSGPAPDLNPGGAPVGVPAETPVGPTDLVGGGPGSQELSDAVDAAVASRVPSQPKPSDEPYANEFQAKQMGGDVQMAIEKEYDNETEVLAAKNKNIFNRYRDTINNSRASQAERDAAVVAMGNEMGLTPEEAQNFVLFLGGNPSELQILEATRSMRRLNRSTFVKSKVAERQAEWDAEQQKLKNQYDVEAGIYRMMKSAQQSSRQSGEQMGFEAGQNYRQNLLSLAEQRAQASGGNRAALARRAGQTAGVVGMQANQQQQLVQRQAQADDIGVQIQMLDAAKALRERYGDTQIVNARLNDAMKKYYVGLGLSQEQADMQAQTSVAQLQNMEKMGYDNAVAQLRAAQEAAKKGRWGTIAGIGGAIVGGAAGFVGTGFNPLGAAAGASAGYSLGQAGANYYQNR